MWFQDFVTLIITHVRLYFFSLKDGKDRDDNIRTEPKYIVFWSQLLMLFQICHSCGAKKPLVNAKELGTQIIVTTDCASPGCPKRHNVWSGQPNMPGYKVPAGNFLLCMAILLVGGSATKVFNMFKHMGVRCISLTSFFYHQRVSECINNNIGLNEE